MVCAKIARWQGEMDEHERYVREGLGLAQHLHRIDLEAQATRELAETFSMLLRNDEAKEMVHRALALAEESGSIIGRAHALAEAGHVQIHLGELDTAETTLEEARRLFTEVGASMNVGRTLLRLGEIALERHEFTTLGEVCARVDPRPQAARGSRDVVREPAPARRRARRSGQARRGRAVRARSNRDGGRARHQLAGLDEALARLGPDRAGSRRRGRGAHARRLGPDRGDRLPLAARVGGRAAGSVPTRAGASRRV